VELETEGLGLLLPSGNVEELGRMIDSHDVSALLRQEASEISRPTTRIEDPLASHIGEESE